MYRTFLSWRYLVSRRTNLIGIVGLFLGVAVPVLILSIMSGFLDEHRRALRGDLADVLIEPLFVARGDAAGSAVERDPRPLLELVRADPRVAHATARLAWYGVASQGGDSAAHSERLLTSTQYGRLSAIELVGVDVLTSDKLALLTLLALLSLQGFDARLALEDELDATELYESLVRQPDNGVLVANPFFPFTPPRRDRSTGLPRAGVVVGDYLYYALGLQRGSVLHVSTVVPDPDTGELVPATREFVVAGTFRSREQAPDTQRILLARSELADFLRDDRPFSEILVVLHDYERDAEAFCADIRAAGVERGLLLGHLPGVAKPSAEVRTWEQHTGSLLAAIGNERVMMGLMLSLVLVVAGFTIFAILMMLVTEKRRDIGVLTAVGATPRGVLATFLMIGFWDALIGATLGAGAGVWAALEIDALERWISSVFGFEIFDRNVFAFDHLPSRVEPLGVAFLFVLAFVLALLFASIPAWRAARLDPLEALRYE